MLIILLHDLTVTNGTQMSYPMESNQIV